MVLAEDGRQMHKSWGNAIVFDDAAKAMGADVMRWMYCTTKPENDMLFGYTGAAEVKRGFLMPLLNVHNFFAIYADLDGWTPDQKPLELSVLDRWMLSRLNRLVERVTDALDDYDAYTATSELWHFVDILSRWYVRRSRRRFWKSEADDDKRAGYSTLYACLRTLVLLLAPIMPFVSEAIYQRLVRGAEPDALESVHLNDWPTTDPGLVDEELMADMELAMKASSLGRAARSQSGIKLRQPLQEAVVVADDEFLKRLKRLTDLIKDELNVKELRPTPDRSELLLYEVRPVSRLLGMKHGHLFPGIVKALWLLDQTEAARLKEGEPVSIEVDDALVEVLPEEVEVESVTLPGYSSVEEGGLLVGVRTEITEELEYEGVARDIVRRIQALRKEAGFEIDDRIETYYSGDAMVEAVFEAEGEYIAAETLSDTLSRDEPPPEAHMGEFDIEGLKLKLGLICIKK